MPERIFYLKLCGEITPSKKAVLNSCMNLVSHTFQLKSVKESGQDITTMTPQQLADTEYAASTLVTKYKQIFAKLRKKGIMIQQKDFKDGEPGMLLRDFLLFRFVPNCSTDCFGVSISPLSSRFLHCCYEGQNGKCCRTSN